MRSSTARSAGVLGRSEPTGQRGAIHLLFAALFVVVVALPILIAVGFGYLNLWSERPQAGATHPARAA
jgi:hypothetical protein